MPKKFQIEVKDDDPAQTGSAWREIARKCEAEIQRLQRHVAELEASEASLSLVIEQQDRTLTRYRGALEKIRSQTGALTSGIHQITIDALK